MRPMLRPGLRVLRRDVRTVQFGMDWPGVGALEETPALRTVLEHVDGFKDTAGVLLAARAAGVDDEEAREALDLLCDCGVVVDQSAVRRGAVGESTWAAWWLLAGPSRTAHDLSRAQRGHRVAVEGDGVLADAVRHTLGCTPLPSTDSPDAATVRILAGDFEHDRARADAAMRDGRPHLWVCVRDLVAVIGPFVTPGETACLRCVDAAHDDLDRTWTTLLDSAACHPRAPSPCEPTLAALAGAWAAQEVLLWSSGLRPQTEGAVVEVPMGFGDVQRTRFDPHPRCGCGWPQSHETMGA